MNCAPASSAPESTSGAISVTFMPKQSARQQPKTQDEKDGVNGRAAGQPDPDADRAERRPEGEPVRRRESDSPIADRGKQQRYACVLDSAQRPGGDALNAVEDEEGGADQQELGGKFDRRVGIGRRLAEEKSRDREPGQDHGERQGRNQHYAEHHGREA